jgi:hypothetical protein
VVVHITSEYRLICVSGLVSIHAQSLVLFVHENYELYFSRGMLYRKETLGSATQRYLIRKQKLNELNIKETRQMKSKNQKIKIKLKASQHDSRRYVKIFRISISYVLSVNGDSRISFLKNSHVPPLCISLVPVERSQNPPKDQRLTQFEPAHK